jgi:hypothetical protein
MPRNTCAPAGGVADSDTAVIRPPLSVSITTPRVSTNSQAYSHQ